MKITREELIKTRIELAKQMNDYIINIGNEEIWNVWIILGVPDYPQEEDYEYIAENDDEWIDLCRLFGRLVLVE